MNAVVNVCFETKFLQRLNESCRELGISRSKFLKRAGELLLNDMNEETVEYLKAARND